MFVMNITVRWDLRLQQSNSDGDNNGNNAGLVPYTPPVVVLAADEDPGPTPIEADHGETEATVYYTVCCASCQTTVASLDMTDEVYHFYGCVASG
jgi:hypothetical protein